MPNPFAAHSRSSAASFSGASIVPLFVCPGVKDVPLEHAVFPHGGGFSKPMPCPMRDWCVWFAAHDLGGRSAFNEFPAEVILAPEFKAGPFSCRRFHEVSRQPIQATQRRAADGGASSPSDLEKSGVGCNQTIRCVDRAPFSRRD